MGVYNLNIVLSVGFMENTTSQDLRHRKELHTKIFRGKIS